MLDTLARWVNEVPPSSQALRYGNPAYRTWHARVVDQAESLMRGVLSSDRCMRQLPPMVVNANRSVESSPGHCVLLLEFVNPLDSATFHLGALAALRVIAFPERASLMTVMKSPDNTSQRLQSISRTRAGVVLCGQLRQCDPHRLRHWPRDHLRSSCCTAW